MKILFLILATFRIEIVRKMFYNKDILERGDTMIDNDYITLTIGQQKNIALIAHDGKKDEMVEWAYRNKDILKNHFLCGTGTTAKLISQKTGLPVRGYSSGPLGGDLQIGARIAEGNIDFMIFFWDPLEAQPHDPDVKALLRIAVVYDIPVAANLSTADFLLTSTYMTTEYPRNIVNYNKAIQSRFKDL